MFQGVGSVLFGSSASSFPRLTDEVQLLTCPSSPEPAPLEGARDGAETARDGEGRREAGGKEGPSFEGALGPGAGAFWVGELLGSLFFGLCRSIIRVVSC